MLPGQFFFSARLNLLRIEIRKRRSNETFSFFLQDGKRFATLLSRNRDRLSSGGQWIW